MFAHIIWLMYRHQTFPHIDVKGKKINIKKKENVCTHVRVKCLLFQKKNLFVTRARINAFGKWDFLLFFNTFLLILSIVCLLLFFFSVSICFFFIAIISLLLSNNFLSSSSVFFFCSSLSKGLQTEAHRRILKQKLYGSSTGVCKHHQ